MIAPLTPNTQAILLLAAPLIVGRSEGNPELLTPSEYNRLARLLRERQKPETLSFALREQTSQSGTQPPEPRPAPVPATPVGPTVLPAEALFSTVREILGRELGEPRSEADVAKLLAVSKPQAKAWLADKGGTKAVAEIDFRLFPRRFRPTPPRQTHRLRCPESADALRQPEPAGGACTHFQSGRAH
ncbi:MAG: hypothetical protein ACYDH9_12630 [Limisphaerales bacterium]